MVQRYWLVMSSLLLCYFNTSYVMVQPVRNKYILYFKENFNTSYVMVQLLIIFLLSLITQHFNTSYVMVQQLYLFWVRSYCYISIHLMLWFNFFMVPWMVWKDNFNTSYVMVQLQSTFFALLS